MFYILGAQELCIFQTYLKSNIRSNIGKATRQDITLRRERKFETIKLLSTVVPKIF